MGTTIAHARHIITTGLAMFSMFFGAGNIVFPLVVGQYAGDMVWMAIIGLMVGAVGIPFLGLLTMTYFDGDHKAFFAPLGKWGSFIIIAFIMILIGPFGALPRCITLTYGTVKAYIPSLSTELFSLFSCIVIFIATVKKSRVVGLLGDILSPLLVASLFMIIIKGLWMHPEALVTGYAAIDVLKFGLYKGYNTMDLLGTFFFSGVIIVGLKSQFPAEKDNKKRMALYALQSSIIGASLLGVVYVGFCRVISYYSPLLGNAEPEFLLGALANNILGNIGGFIVSMAVGLACLTTAITLTLVFTEFLQRQIFHNHVSYIACLVGTLIVSGVVADFGFARIIAILEPILMVIYPALIVLTGANLLNKMVGRIPVKLPFIFTTVASFLWYYLPTVVKTVGIVGL